VDPKIIVLAVVASLVIAAIAVGVMQRRKAALRRRFGPEYERAVREQGSDWRAQTALEQRTRRVDKLHIRKLDAAERDQYAERWRTVQSRFVDDPKDAVVDADETVSSLMGAIGYPMADFEQRAADLSVNHAQVVDNYRAAHEIALLHRKGQASTEDLRQAMIYYRSLFEELLNGRNSDKEIREVA
jgi:hypothetical protein